MPVRFRVVAVGTMTAERQVEIADGAAEIRIGRRADLELPLPFAGLSALHARVWRDGEGAWLVEDLGSTNGTQVGGQPLAPGHARRLAAGDRLTLAEVTLVFDGADAPSDRAAPAAPPEGTATIARRLVNDLFAAAPDAPAPELEVVGGPEAGRRLALRDSDRPYVVGRGDRCDLALVLDEVSREHASFTRRWAGVFVTDLASKNGIRLWGTAVTGERRLSDGDVVEVGPVSLRLRDPEDRYLKEIAALGEAGVTVAPLTTASRLPAAAPPPPRPVENLPPLPVDAPASPPAGGVSASTRFAMAVAGTVLLAIAGAIVALLVAR